MELVADRIRIIIRKDINSIYGSECMAVERLDKHEQIGYVSCLRLEDGCLCKMHVWENYVNQGYVHEAYGHLFGYLFEKYGDHVYLDITEENEDIARDFGFEKGVHKGEEFYILYNKEFFYYKHFFTKDEYKYLRRQVGWEALEDSQVNSIIENSEYMISAYHQGRLAGIARCISDKGYLYLLCDVMIEPTLQGKGIGKRMLGHFIEEIKMKIGDKFAKIYIMSLPGKEEFYKKLGFKEDPATGLTIVLGGK